MLKRASFYRHGVPSLPWAGFCLAIGLGLGAILMFVGMQAISPAHASRYRDPPVKASPANYSRFSKLDILSRSLTLLEQYYVKPLDDQALIYGAIKGMTSELDPHTTFLSPDEAQMLREDMDGQFGGVGLVVVMLANQQELEVKDVVEGGPADRVGMKVGDRIVSIEGKSIKDYKDLREAVSRMRGVVGTPVRFVFVRGDAAPRKAKLTRALVNTPALNSRYLGQGLGIIRLREFHMSSADELRQAIQSLDKQSKGDGVKGLQGIVLDLRDNGGGLLDQAIKVADQFVDRGVIVQTRGRDGKVIEKWRAHQVGTRRNLPLVVLINKGSASASEIVAGALQDHRRALIVGEQSYGKGSVQAPYELGDGSLLKMTIAMYYTPADRMIQASGIRPDVKVGMEKTPYHDSRPEFQPERNQARHLRPEDFGRFPSKQEEREQAGQSQALMDAVANDPQLQVAMNHLQAWSRLGPKRKRHRW